MDCFVAMLLAMTCLRPGAVRYDYDADFRSTGG